jgi:FixJ family two-component response regulator
MARTPLTILVVDDDRDVSESLGALLRSHGFRVLTFVSASDLLDEAARTRHDCVIIDYAMPDMNGIQLLSELGKQGIPAPAIMTTGDPRAVIRAAALDAGAVGVLGKPFLATELLEMLNGITRMDGGRDR